MTSFPRLMADRIGRDPVLIQGAGPLSGRTFVQRIVAVEHPGVRRPMTRAHSVAARTLLRLEADAQPIELSTITSAATAQSEVMTRIIGGCDSSASNVTAGLVSYAIGRRISFGNGSKPARCQG